MRPPSGEAVARASNPEEGTPAERSMRQFEAALARIHGLDATSEPRRLGVELMDTRQAELQAMVHAFLGTEYDDDKVQHVAALQSKLHGFQANLHRQLELQRISAEDYVNQFNAAMRHVFVEIEEVLGSRDFEALFGCPLDEVQGYIDLEAFVSQHRH